MLMNGPTVITPVTPLSISDKAQGWAGAATCALPWKRPTRLKGSQETVTRFADSHWSRAERPKDAPSTLHARQSPKTQPCPTPPERSRVTLCWENHPEDGGQSSSCPGKGEGWEAQGRCGHCTQGRHEVGGREQHQKSLRIKPGRSQQRVARGSSGAGVLTRGLKLIADEGEQLAEDVTVGHGPGQEAVVHTGSFQEQVGA